MYICQKPRLGQLSFNDLFDQIRRISMIQTANKHIYKAPPVTMSTSSKDAKVNLIIYGSNPTSISTSNMHKSNIANELHSNMI